MSHDMYQLKFSLKSEINILIGEPGPLGPTPGYALAQDLKKTFPDRKNQASYVDFAQSFLNYAGN